jgi:F-type H+-transporting ATPase subunit b
MNFDWTTFVLEAINFLILVWLLKRFLYRPVLDVIARRQAGVAGTLADAAATRAEAQRLRTEYAGRMSDWERERARLRQALDAELDALRAKGLAALAADIESERKRDAAARLREREVEQRELETRALQQASAFAARLLERFAGPELDARIIDMLLADLEALPAPRRAALCEALTRAGNVEVRSARAIDPALRQRIEAALAALAGRHLQTMYTIDPALQSGVRLRAGAWEVAADLSGELAAFAEFAAHG